jgi:putative inorganic carbon (HCO3(-)) transporter
MSRKSKKKRTESKAERKKIQQGPEADPFYWLVDNILFALVLLIIFLRGFLSGRTYPHWNHLFHIAVGIASVLWLIKCYLRGTLELHDRLLTGFVIAFALACSITFFTTVNKGITLRYIYEIISYTLLFLIIANNFRDSGSIKAAFVIFLVSALLLCSYGIYQWRVTLEQTREFLDQIIKSGDQGGLSIPINSGILYRLKSQRPFSTFLFPNAYAIYLAIVGSLTIGFIWSMWEKIKKSAGAGKWLLVALLATLCILIPWNLWLTKSRGGMMSAASVLLVFLIIGFWRKKKPSAEKLVAAFIVLAITMTFIAGGEAFSAESAPAYDESFWTRIKDTASIKQRITYWKAALEIVKDNPWFGVGWGAFEKAYPRYMILGGYPVKLAHNNYLQVWAETGIAGLNTFVGMWLAFLYTFWRKVRPGAAGDLRGIACGLGAGVIAFLVNNLVDIALYLPPLMYFVYMILGLLVAVPTENEEEDKFSLRFSAFPSIALIAGACLLILLLYRSFMGMIVFMEVEDTRNAAFPTKFAMQKGIPPPTPQQKHAALRQFVPLLEESIEYFPLDSETHHMLGDTYLRLFQMEKSTHLLDKAIVAMKRSGELNPLSPQVFNSLATAYWTKGNATADRDMFFKALEAEKKASENFPVNPEFHDRLRQIYSSLDMTEQAKEEARQRQELKKHFKEN